jgi:hypothetical protein
VRTTTVVYAFAALIVTGCFSISAVVALVFSGCVTIQRPDPNVPAYSAEAAFDGYTIHIDLYHNHERLAEYRKVVEVRQGDRVIASREYHDTGGLASFYLLRKGTRITVVDGVVRGFVLDTAKGTVDEVQIDNVPQDFPEQSFGRFMFGPKHQYRWFLREELPEWAKQ